MFATKKDLASYSKCDGMFFVWEFSFPQLFSSHALFVFSAIYSHVLASKRIIKLKLNFF